MASPDKAMISKGSQDSTRSVIEQGETTLSNATTHLEKLLKAGLSPDWTKVMKEALATVRASRGTQTEIRDESKNATVSEGAARSDAKRFIRQARNAGLLVVRDGPVEGITTTNFKLGDIGRSSSEVIDQLAKLRPHVATLDEQLKPYFEGQSALAELDRVNVVVSQATGDQASKRANAPLETLALYEAQGRLIDLVERVNLVARIAFDSQTAIRALFNKDVLLRARRRSAVSLFSRAPVLPTDSTAPTDDG